MDSDSTGKLTTAMEPEIALLAANKLSKVTTNGFRCDQCKYSAVKKTSMERHISTVHEKVRNFSCDECNYAAAAKKSLAYHINMKDKKLKEFKCTHCKFESAFNGNLRKHL